MNNIFDFTRFGKLLSKEIKEYYSRYGTVMLTFLGFYVAYWLIMVIFGSQLEPISNRMGFVYAVVMAVLLIAPFKLYDYTNNRKTGISYAMLPASSLEKLLSMFFNCAILTPLVFIAAFLTLDSILILFSKILSIWGIHSGFESLAIVSGYFFNTDNFQTLLMCLVTQTGCIYGNLFFRKHKISKTLLVYIALFFIFTIITTLYLYIFSVGSALVQFGDDGIFSALRGDFTQADVADKMKIYVVVLKYLFWYVAPVTLYILSYFRIKTVKY